MWLVRVNSDPFLSGGLVSYSMPLQWKDLYLSGSDCIYTPYFIISFIFNELKYHY